MRRPPTAWQRRWRRWHRLWLIVLAIAMVLCAIFVSLGVAALLFVALLGLATFGGGTPTDNGSAVPPAQTWTGIH